ncbi:MAG: assimilatory sulfite reductase (NADPH) flavoprotein subunit [Gammaproteobacteria bacterium]|nr:assimilatory sulfite reductase (NADPH) flavoprotein subunit [Gammaproteobacteria bacterium]
MDAVASDALPTPLAADKSVLLAQLVEGLGARELYWVAAWVAQRAADPLAATPAAATVTASRLTLLYGSQTGNAKRCAERIAAQCEAAGLPVRLVRANTYTTRDLGKESHLLVVISTQGVGEPPDDARGLFEFITGKRAPRLPNLHFAVLGLGDSSYPDFCTIGRRLDERLAELGGTRFAPFGACDVEIDQVAVPWSAEALKQARELLGKDAGATGPARVTTLHAVTTRSAHSSENPFHARVLANQRIVARDCTREVRHLELSLEGSGLRYAPGDAIGVWPRNPPQLVAQWLEVLKLDGGQLIEHDGRALPLAEWLGRERELTRLARGFVAAHAQASGSDELAAALKKENPARLNEILATHQPIDLLRRHPAAWNASELVAALRPLTARLYSISSSPLAVGEEEVHLTVADVAYPAFGETHWGAASHFLGGLAEDASVPVYVEANERFRLPADGSRDVIMIGPGTGVAPFRAFVQERRESGASGRNWLFYGSRNFTRDFLYQLEWQEALKAGALHRLDLAFSRDTDRKIYVQDRLREHGRELYHWLQGGAHLYVCGDAKHMARDVNDALAGIAMTHGGRTEDDAKEWLSDLLTQGRYARDVY